MRAISSRWAALAVGAVVVSCSGGGGGAGGDTPPPPQVLTGHFIDSAVIGISYETPTRRGVTGPNGEFSYVAGESVTFFIGALRFPSAVAQPIVTPLTIAGTTSMTDPEALNIARLLMSIDANGDPDDGILIPEGASSVAVAIDFEVPVEAFATSAVTAFVDALDGDDRTGQLRTAEEALGHLGNLVAGTYRTPGPSPDVLVLLADGSFLYTESEGEPTNGVDAGTWRYDPVAGTITFTLTFETNAAGGIADGIGATSTATASLSAAGDLTLDGGDGAVTLLRELPGAGLAGTWRHDGSLGATLVLCADGEFVYVEIVPGRPTNGLEAGTWSYDASRDQLTFSIVYSENPLYGIWEADGPVVSTGVWFDPDAPATFLIGDSLAEASALHREGAAGTPPGAVVTGRFVDSPVVGIGYETATQSGVTGPGGEFLYRPGEAVTFFIGALRFPPVPAQPFVTPLTLAGTTLMRHREAVNVARLLMSIDANGDAADGLAVPEGAASIATAIDFDVPVAEFATTAVTAFVDALDGDGGAGELRTEAEAVAHLGKLVAGTYRALGPAPDVLVLFADGHFLYTESAGPPTNGVDAGTYVFDPVTQRITFTRTFETNTSGGLGDGIGTSSGADAFLTTAGDLVLDGGHGAATLYRQPAGTGVAGTWRFDATLGGTLVFFDDGEFIYVEAGTDDDTTGLEAGTYVYDAAANALTFRIAYSENPNGGIWEQDGPNPTTGLWFDPDGPGSLALGDSRVEAGVAYRE